MPPKKAAKAAGAVASANSETPVKTRNAKAAALTTAASTRPRRASTTMADAQPAAKRAKTERSAAPAPKPARVNADSKAPKTFTSANTSKPRGRPPKALKEQAHPGEASGRQAKAPKPLPKKRGRPSNSSALSSTAAKNATKSKVAVPNSDNVDKSKSKGQDHPVPSRGRGRPATKKPNKASAHTTKTTLSQKKRSAATRNDDEENAEGQAHNQEPAAKRQRGRPSMKSTDINGEDEQANQEGASYWLMKAEPESRSEKGVDVKFSIDDLKASTEPEPWNGVRNHVAKNNMKAMKKGDQAFFYHSNCKTPGIVGIMEIVEEASPDESAFDENDPYFDAKAKRDNPNGWVIVRVEFRQKFDEPVTLDQMKNLAKENEEIADMQLLKQSRLSVSRVSPAEWDFILKQVGIDPAPAKIYEPLESSGDQPQVNGEDMESTSPDLVQSNHVSKSGARATSVPAPANDKLAAPKKTGSRSGSRARSVPLNGPTAETGPAGRQTETPISHAMARVAEEPEI